jgi:hypothetical protein
MDAGTGTRTCTRPFILDSARDLLAIAFRSAHRLCRTVHVEAGSDDVDGTLTAAEARR